MDLHISGKTAMVTGGTRGIGLAIVETFLAEGANVAFCARDAKKVGEKQAELSGRGNVSGTAFDLRDSSAITQWVADTAERFNSIDMVVCSASALAIPDTESNWVECFQMDMMSTVHLVNATIAYLENSSVASIVAIASVSGREVDFAAGPYGTVKSAIIAYMSGLALKLASKNIRVNAISPGNTYHEGGVWPQIENDDPELFATALKLNPTGRMGTPQEIASSVVFISSPVSSRTTGANLLIDGALTRGIQF
ncbi:MAG: SDR family NAD(P)-dependent oxidoreductase [Rhodanobacteraceae bacterium]